MARLNDATSNLLNRHSSYHSNPSQLSQGQLSLDAAVGTFTEKASDSNNLLAMTAGSFAFRFAKLGFMEGAAASGLSRILPRFAVNGAASVFALSTEVTAFRGTSNLLTGTALSETFEAKAWKSSFVDFALLKGFGQLRTNPVLTNLAQSSAMVMGRDISAQFGWMEKDHRSYVERLAEAQATNFALGAGTALFGVFTGGRTQVAERLLDTKIEAMGHRFSSHNQPLFGEAHTTMSARSPEILSMAANPEPSPTRHSQDARRDSGKHNIGRTGRTWRGVADRISRLMPDLDMNFLVNPQKTVKAMPTRNPAEPIRSVQEGMDRARIRGLDRETLSFLRWGAAQLRHQPEVRQQFFEHMRNVFAVQQGLRELWNPILEKFPRPNLEKLNQLARNYLDRLAGIAQGHNHYYAEHFVLRARLEGLALKTREDYARLSDAQLREIGIEPESIASIGRNAHVFTPREMEARLDHPLLRELPETAQLREAYDRYQRELTSFNESLRQAEESMAGLRSKIATTSDVERRAALEKEIKDIAAPFNKQYWQLCNPVNEAMRQFLSEPATARVFLVQNAYHNSLRTAVMGMSPRQMAAHLKAQEAQLTGTATEQARMLRAAAEGIELLGERGFLARTFYAAARLFNKDPLSPQVLRRRYELALTRLVEEASPAFWNLPKPEEAALGEAMEAQSSYFREYYRVVEESREAVRGLKDQNQDFWNRFDAELKPLVLQDLRLQQAQANGHIEMLRQRIGDDFNDRGSSRNESYAQELTRLNEAADKALGELNTANLDRKINSRDLNRKREAALQRVQDLFTFARRIDAREGKIARVTELFGVFLNGKNGNTPGRLSPVSAMTLPYVTKFQNRWHQNMGESLRVLGPLVWETLPQVLRLINAVKREHSFSTLQQRFAEWSVKIAHRRGDSMVVDPNTDALAEYQAAQFAGKHAGWPDFAVGPTPGVGIAQRAGQGTGADTPLILAKDGLGRLMGPLFNSAINMLTEGVGDSSKQFDQSVTRAARTLAMGDAGNASLRPGHTAAYDELTMSVVNLISPYRFAPFEGTSEIISLPQGGRSFRIADRAMALSSRPQNVIATLSLNSSTMYPKPDRPLPIRNTPLTTVTEWMPVQALGWGLGAHELHSADLSPHGNGNGNGNGHEPHQSIAPRVPEPASANWLRSHWYNMATVPEYRVETPSVRRIFGPYEKPLELAVEQTLEQMFGGMDGVYPNAQVSRHLEQRAQTLRSQAGKEVEAVEAHRASESYDARLIETHLDRSLLALREARATRSLQKESAELGETIERRKAHLYKIQFKQRRGLALTETEQREWQALREAARNVEQNNPLWQVLELGQAFQRELPDTSSKELTKLLNQRLNQLQVALARVSLGEPLAPAEKLLLEEMKAAFTQADSPVADRVVTALRNPELSPEAQRKLIAEETIREETRRLARLLPGAGRGSIDAVEESVHDHARVVYNAAGEVQRGPRSLPRTYHQAGRFVAHCMQMGFIESVVDLLTNNRWNLYTAHSAWVGRKIMEPMQWRPEVDVATLRNIEDLRIRARAENRPIVIAASHESWTDITSIMSLLPEARFNAKKELVFTLVLAPPLIGGRHNLISRGNAEKSRQQMQRAGRRMLDYGVATVNFHGGTRSKTATLAPAKKGTAHLALDTDAFVLNLSMSGPQQVMPLSWGELLTRGGATHRRVFLRASVLDSRDYASGDKKSQVSRFTEDIQNKLMDQSLGIFQELYLLGSRGDVMAQAQFMQTVKRLEAGMALVRENKLDEAKAWAEGDSGKNKGMKTDVDFLIRFTRWVDSVHSTSTSSPQ